MKRHFCLTIAFFLMLSYTFGQTTADQFQLPQGFCKLTIGKSTEADVIVALGKPTEREEITKDQCTEIKNPRTMFYQYASEKMDIRFWRKNKNSKYILQSINFSIGSPILFGGAIKVGESTTADLFNKFGNPEYYREGESICYYIKESKRYYTFLVENKIIVRVLICQEKNCL